MDLILYSRNVKLGESYQKNKCVIRPRPSGQENGPGRTKRPENSQVTCISGLFRTKRPLIRDVSYTQATYRDGKVLVQDVTMRVD